MKKTFLLALLAVVCMADSCDEPVNSDSQQRIAQEQLSKQSNNEVGMPAIVNFQEKRMLKMILELRDTKVSTITYIVDFNAHIHKLCDSVGYGVPYATQYTNPQRLEHLYQGGVTLPQADPNGLFSPAAAEGTWVLCLNKSTKKVDPVYVEPRIIVSPFPMSE